MKKSRFLALGLTGCASIFLAYYSSMHWLWRQMSHSRVQLLERELLSALSGDISEGNLFKLEASLQELYSEGLIAGAELRQVGRGAGTLFKTQGFSPESRRLLDDFACGMGRRSLAGPGGGVALNFEVPVRIAGADCVAMSIVASFPEDLQRLRRWLLAITALAGSAIFALFYWMMLALHKRVLQAEFSRELLRAEKDAEIGKVAAQVAHDIRSPLAAMESVLKSVSALPEDQRIIIRSAVGRIKDIAGMLILKNKEAADAGAPAREEAAPHLLSSLIEPVITEKRLQFRARLGVDLDFRMDGASYGLFAGVQSAEFKRVLSNLINNAFEALGEKGTVSVTMSADEKLVRVSVQDNGKGIPPEILAKLGRRGATQGKEGGSGLGLFHAKTSVEAWGGELQMRSEPGKGTEASLVLPRAEPPGWFVSGLAVEPGRRVAVLDDDTSIHQVWQGRFAEIGVQVLHFSTPSEFRAWVRADPRESGETLFLVDYELLGHQETGLSLVEELGLGERAVLVTSRYEEKAVLENSLRLKVRMIPKGLAGFVPVALKSAPASIDAVLIDDDPLARMVWKSAAKQGGINLKLYSRPGEFLADLGGLEKGTPIYLDSHLGGGVLGENFAKELHAAGFTEIYLATGHSPDVFGPMPWLRGIRGKEPPWG